MRAKYHIYLTAEERRVVINSLIDLRNNLISQGMYTDLVDELLIQWRLHIHVKEIICCRI